METNRTQLYTLSLGLDIAGTPFTPEERREAVRMVADTFDAFTVLEARGYWRGQPEDVLRFEIIGSSGMAFQVRKLARELAVRFGQQAVLMTQNGTTATCVAQEVDKDWNL
jgi:hypothetical protein